jgi:mono/diheme cytochrome c family protein
VTLFCALRLSEPFMKICLLSALLFFLGCTSTKPIRQDGPKEAHHLVSFLFYIETDYHKAIQDEKEWEQHKVIANDLFLIAKELPGNERWSEPLQKIKTLLDTRATAEEVEPLCRDLQRALTEEYKLSRSPAERPLAGRGESLYKRMCVDCHDSNGGANTLRGRALKRPPASLIDATVLAPLSPYRVYSLLSFGLGEMPSFELSSVEDRWALAFYVFSLQHKNRGASSLLLSTLPATIPSTFEALAETSESELKTLLQNAKVTDPEAAMRALRVLAPYQ